MKLKKNNKKTDALTPDSTNQKKDWKTILTISALVLKLISYLVLFIMKLRGDIQ